MLVEMLSHWKVHVSLKLRICLLDESSLETIVFVDDNKDSDDFIETGEE